MNLLDRKEAVALLKELGDEHLIVPSLVLIERTNDRFQLKIKGSYDNKLIEIFLKIRGFSYEEDKDYLTIFS